MNKTRAPLNIQIMSVNNKNDTDKFRNVSTCPDHSSGHLVMMIMYNKLITLCNVRVGKHLGGWIYEWISM